MVKLKINKLCESFGAKRFQMPANIQQFNEKITEIDEENNNTKQTLSLTKKNIENKLS